MRWNKRGVQACSFDPGQELVRLANAGVGLPAGQCFDRDDITSTQFHDRLEVGADLAAVEGLHEFGSRLVEARGRDADGGTGGGDRCLGGVERGAQADTWQASADANPCCDAGATQGLAKVSLECHRVGGVEPNGEDAELEAGDPCAEVATIDHRC